MTDGSTEPKFSNRHSEALKTAPEKTSAKSRRETREAKPETAPDTGRPTELADQKTADFFQVLRRKKPIKAIPQVRDEVTIRIEKILEDGVGDAYGRLSPVAKQEFKLKGEETARKVRELLGTSHVKVKKIFRLIWEWLKMLPGVNRFFLEQEAKIKTDRILAVHKQHPPR